jgi:prepilin-type N-terminal cleavage/methylation domain-containing protein
MKSIKKNTEYRIQNTRNNKLLRPTFCILHSNNKGFTFVELVVSITIISILSVLGFVSYSKNLEDARDSQRKSELS